MNSSELIKRCRLTWTELSLFNSVLSLYKIELMVDNNLDETDYNNLKLNVGETMNRIHSLMTELER